MKRMAKYALMALLGSTVGTGALAQHVVTQGAVTHLVIPDQTTQAASGIDFENARALPLPDAGLAPPTEAESLLRAPSSSSGTPGSSPGGAGDGKQTPVQLPRTLNPASQDEIVPQEFGSSGQPFTTNRVNAFGDNTQLYYAFRPTGRLFFNVGSATYVCSASLIKPGVIVTAAHCVTNFGRRQFYSNWKFVPSYSNSSAPYGVWSATQAWILTSYYIGTDPCTVSGVVCQNDVAVLTLASQAGAFAGNRAGWYGYGWNGYGYNGSRQALIDQLGYPVALDGGGLMQRNDSQGYVSSSFSNNTIIGSLMTGGSSGGPWLVNLGMQPALSGTSFGNAAARNTVVGVTSWGYVNTAVKQQGASSFTSGNIVPLVSAACTSRPGNC